MTKSATEVNQLKQAPAPGGVIPEVRHRWSPRSFADRPVSPADLKLIFEGVRWAASSYNEQPWRFIVGVRGSEAYGKIFNSLGEFNQAWAKTAPVLILGVAKPAFTHNNTPNHYAYHDLGQAAATLCYQAISQGLFTHQMAGFDHEVARKAFGIPEDYIIGSVTALGYLGEPSALPPGGMQDQEVSPRTRKNLSDFVFDGWEKPATFVE